MIDETTFTQLQPDLLRTFVAAADSGSFTNAARMVHRTQSAVSMQIKRLETDLGRELFRREGRGVTLSAEGDVLYRYARRLLSLHDEALAAVSGPRLYGVVRFGAPEDYATQYLPGALKRFAAVHPNVLVDVLCGESSHLRDTFQAGELDVILTTEKRLGREDSKILPLAWLVAERGAPVDQRPLPLALYHSGCQYRNGALAVLEAADIPYRVAYGSPSMTGVMSAIQAGLAVGPVSVGTTMPGCRLAMPDDGLPPIPSVAVSLQTAKGNQTEIVDSFAGFIRQELALKSS